MNDLEIVMRALDLDEDEAATVLDLCDLLDQEDATARYGYAKDTPGGRNLGEKLVDDVYRARLLALALAEELSNLVSALTE